MSDLSNPTMIFTTNPDGAFARRKLRARCALSIGCRAGALQAPHGFDGLGITLKSKEFPDVARVLVTLRAISASKAPILQVGKASTPLSSLTKEIYVREFLIGQRIRRT